MLESNFTKTLFPRRQESIKTIILVIDKNNFQIIKTQADMTMKMDAETVGASAGDFESITMVMNMDMSFFDYNKTVNIELPPEAFKAEEVSP